MILIAHRGNINGPSINENSPELIFDTLQKGYHVEVDVWCLDGVFYLGHDAPTYYINESFFIDDRVWCHAKNFEALQHLLHMNVQHVFWHNTDDYTLTSCGKIWTYPGKNLCQDSIAVMPETIMTNILNLLDNDIYGVCSDYVSLLK